MTCFFAAKTSPNMIGLTVKNIIIKKQLKKKFKVPGDLLSQCGLAGLLMCPLRGATENICFIPGSRTIAPHKFFSVLYLVSDYRFLTINSIALLYFHFKIHSYLIQF